MARATAEDVSEFLSAVAERCVAAQRPDLAERVRLAAARASRPSTVVCVVGEYKQGKSALLNALVGFDVCPVHDDLATSTVTIVHRADEVTVQVRRSRDGEVVLESIPLEAVTEVVTEQGDPEIRQTVEHVSIGVPSPVLVDGLVLVDTPGVGGLSPANRQTVLGFLPYADAVIFVSDASAEVSAPEIEFLEEAAAACSHVLVAVTKIDLYAEWQRIAELDADHLRRAEMNLPLLAVSAEMSSLARGRSDEGLEEESLVPALRDLVQEEVVAGAGDRAALRALGESQVALAAMRAVAESERATLADPATVAQRRSDLGQAQEALNELRAAGARWSVLLQDGFGDLRSTVDFELRSGIRELLRQADEELADADPRSDWQGYTESLKGRVAGLVEEVVAGLDEGAVTVAERVAGLLSDAVPDGVGGAESLDVTAVWEAVQRDLDDKRSALTTGLSAIRGMQSGVILLGLVGQLVGLTLMLPVVLGGGALLGIKQVADERKRRLERRRHEARTVVRQFLDQVQFEMGSRLHRAIADMQRGLRDEFAARVAEMQETCRLQLAAAERDLSEHTEGRDERLGHLEQHLADLAALDERLHALDRSSAGNGTTP